MMKDLRDEIKKPKKVKVKNPIEQILDEKNNENIILYDADNKPIEFEQVALIPLESSDLLYAILIPVTPMQGVNPGEGIIMSINEATYAIDIVNDEKIINEVLTIYQKLIEDGDKE